ncbi:endonuclease domain-containing protein [Draconibacterium sediminis]|uniref:endonuclease domain-containing protein n=1 Tax=Draconibacterium sediminis TaxID=1544798 RepID=UPI0026E9AD23|nr:endonuclease domain-containing protein [Draconibacterium sediminis]
MRNHGTAAEATLWKILRQSQVGGYKFRRQHSIGKYIVDFFCFELMLAIELDGEVHADLNSIARDTERD